MSTATKTNIRFVQSFMGVLGWLLLTGSALGQLPTEQADPITAPTALPALPPMVWGSVLLPPVPRPPPIHLFMMQSPFLDTPVGLDADDDGTDDSSAPDPFDPDVDVMRRVQIALGNDNPFFDFQAPDNPGRVGYYRLHAQYQLVDHASTSVTLGMQAFTPAGLESEGLAHGPTVFRPNFAWWQDLGNGQGITGFVSKSVLPNNRLFDRLERGYRCGLAWASALTDDDAGTAGSVHFFMEALARYQPDTYNGQRPPTLQVLPGLHWQVNDRCWMSGAVALPIGPNQADEALWQITCWWKF